MGGKRKQILLLLTVGVGMAVGACSSQPLSRSKFLTGFSAADVIKASYDQGSSKQTTISVGETSSKLGNRGIHHRDEIADLVISQNDEASFLSRVKGTVEEQLRTSGCRVFGEGFGGSNYVLEYTDGSVNGWVDIWGLRGQGDSYKLVIIITEN
jgi:hypothetical protein